MPHSIDRDTVEQVASLACIHLSDSETAEMLNHLAEVIEYTSQLKQAEISSSIKPYYATINSVDVIRDDRVAPSTDRDSMLRNAPVTDGRCYLVPPVIK